MVEFGSIDGKTRRRPVDDHRQTRTVGLSRGEITKHGRSSTLFQRCRLGGQMPQALARSQNGATIMGHIGEREW